mgnify:CR=1 FL=1
MNTFEALYLIFSPFVIFWLIKRLIDSCRY